MDYVYIENASPKQIIILGVIFACAVIVLVALLSRFEKHDANKSRPKIIIGAIIFGVLFYLALCLRAYLSFQDLYHPDLTTFFIPWTNSLMEKPLSDFYFLSDPSVIDTFHDYTPLYMYYLYVLGLIMKAEPTIPLLGLVVMQKAAALICDMVATYFIYKTAKKITGKSFVSYAIALAYAFNPAVICDSAVWGQVDGITAMFFVLVFYFMVSKKDVAAIFTCIVGFCFKLQFIFCAPAIGVYYLYRWIKKDKKCAVDCLYGFLYGLAFFVAVNAPFTYKIVFSGNWLFPLKLYVNQVANYGYYVLNAFNLYGALDLNFIPLPNSVAAIGLVNVAIIFFVCAVCVFYYFRHPNLRSVPLLCAFVITTIFTFSFKMHERYMFGAIAALFLALSFKRDVFLTLVASLISLAVFYNIGILMIIETPTFDYHDPRMVVGSIFELVAYAAFLIYMLSGLYNKKDALTPLAVSSGVNESFTETNLLQEQVISDTELVEEVINETNS